MYKCSKSTLADTGTWALHMTRSFPTTSGPHGLRVQQPHGTESAALSVSIPFPCSPVEAQIEVPMTSGKARLTLLTRWSSCLWISWTSSSPRPWTRSSTSSVPYLRTFESIFISGTWVRSTTRQSGHREDPGSSHL